MVTPSILAVYDMAHAIATLLPAAAAGRPGSASACVSGLANAAAAVAFDSGRASADEVRAAGRLRDILAGLTAHAPCPRTAAVVSELVVRWFGPRGLPPGDVAAFDRLAASLGDGEPSG